MLQLWKIQLKMAYFIKEICCLTYWKDQGRHSSFGWDLIYLLNSVIKENVFIAPIPHAFTINPRLSSFDYSQNLRLLLCPTGKKRKSLFWYFIWRKKRGFLYFKLQLQVSVSCFTGSNWVSCSHQMSSGGKWGMLIVWSQSSSIPRVKAELNPTQIT